MKNKRVVEKFGFDQATRCGSFGSSLICCSALISYLWPWSVISYLEALHPPPHKQQLLAYLTNGYEPPHSRSEDEEMQTGGRCGGSKEEEGKNEVEVSTTSYLS